MQKQWARKRGPASAGKRGRQVLSLMGNINARDVDVDVNVNVDVDVNVDVNVVPWDLWDCQHSGTLDSDNCMCNLCLVGWK